MPGTGHTQELDQTHTHIGFELRTRWGQRLQGSFPVHEGRVRTLPGGRQQVSIDMDARAVEMTGSPRYTELSRGAQFFDVEHYPMVVFESDPYPVELLRHGGQLTGTLHLHGVSRRESFTVAPGACARPTRDCDLIAHGSVRREDYGMDGWQVAVRGTVRFQMRLRLRAEVAH